jgi:hypothetical protein
MESVQAGKVRYKLFGPFPFSSSSEATHRQALREFWKLRELETATKGLSGAIGVYVWTMKKGNKWIPWNVGLTDRQGFSKRFVQKENSFLKLRSKDPDAEIEVYLLALQSKTGRFRRPTGSKQVRANHWLETMLIGSAYSVNPNLRNTANAGYFKNAVVDGYLNDKQEERNQTAQSFSQLFKA